MSNGRHAAVAVHRLTPRLVAGCAFPRAVVLRPALDVLRVPRVHGRPSGTAASTGPVLRLSMVRRDLGERSCVHAASDRRAPRPRVAQTPEPSGVEPLERTTPPSEPSKNCSGFAGSSPARAGRGGFRSGSVAGRLVGGLVVPVRAGIVREEDGAAVVTVAGSRSCTPRVT